MKATVVIFLSIILAACSSGPRVQTLYGAPITPSNNHREGIVQTATVGSEMTTSRGVLEMKLATLNAGMSATTLHRKKVFTLVANPGDYRLVRESGYGEFYEAVTSSIKLNDKYVNGGIFLSTNKLVSSAIFWGPSARSVGPNVDLNFFIAGLNTLPDVTIKTTEVSSNVNTGFISTLTYSGLANNQIKFSYKEYINGLIRDGFKQEVALDYKPETEYTFKSAKIKVHKADTSQITYTVIHSL